MLESIVAAVLLASLVLYALTGGADFGGGMWDLWAYGPRAAKQRDVISHAIGPIWEANHVWLILVIVLLFTGFPVGFAAIMTALHIPLTIMLVGIVLRGSTFVFRKYDHARGHARWSTIFGIASCFTPFVQGLSLGALATGEIRVANGEVSTGFFAGWLSPFAFACGFFALGLFAFLSATYLTVECKEDRALQDDFRIRAIGSGLALAPIALFVFITSRHGATEMYRGLTDWWAPLLLAWTSLCAISAIVALWRRKYRLARAAAIAQVTLILLGWCFAQYPYLAIPDLDIHATAAPPQTLRFLLIALGLGALLLFPSLAYLFYIFKRPEALTGTRADEA